jgi:hypothetical protein
VNRRFKLALLLVAVAVFALALAARATVPSTSSSAGPYTCNGTTTVFAVPFKFAAATHLVVTRKLVSTGAESTLYLSTDYTVLGAGASAGGSLTLVAGSRCAAGYTLSIKRVTPKLNSRSFRSSTTVAPAAVEDSIDQLTAMTQEIVRDQADADAVQNRALAQGAVGGNDTLIAASGAATAAPLSARFSHVINVKDDFGAKGDWNGTAGTDDTAAFMAAAAAARAKTQIVPGSTHGKGITVFVPRGVYMVTQELVFADGVCLVGAGREATVLAIQHPDATTDGVAWRSPSIDPYGQGGCLRDIKLWVVGKTKGRDVVSLVNWGEFEIANAIIIGGGRYGVYAPDGISLTFRDTIIGSNTAAGFWAGDTLGSVATTYHFRHVYFSNASDGPGADVAGLQLSFDSCIFESNGSGTPSAGHGIRVRSGTVTLNAPYFENNAGWMGTFGTDGDSQVTIVNPIFMTGGYSPADKGAFLFDRVTGGAVIGGSFTAMGPHSIKFTSNAENVAVMGVKIGPNEPEFDPEGGKSISQYPGLVNYMSSETGDRMLSGFISEASIARVVPPPGQSLTLRTRLREGNGIIFDSDSAVTTTLDNLILYRYKGSEIGRLEYRGIARYNGLVLKSSVGTPFAAGLSTAVGELVLNSGNADSPGIHFYYGDNLNVGLDVKDAKLRIVRNLDESVGGVAATIDPAGGTYQFGDAGPMVMAGAFDPEGAATAPVGSLFLRSNGGAGTSFYVKQAGSGFTGWVGK